MKNSEDLDKYYQMVNEIIDKYLDRWKINPKNLKKYLGKNEKMKNFLKRNGLNDIDKINRVISDILDDRIFIKLDSSVMKFESFLLKESVSHEESSICLSKGIEITNINHEKILADLLDVSLSEIEVVDTKSHEFLVGNEKYIVYTKEEIESINLNIVDYCMNCMLEKDILIEVGQDKSITIKCSSVMDNDSLENNISSLVSSDSKNIILSVIKKKFKNPSLIECRDFVCNI